MSTTTIRDGTHDDLFPAFTVFRLALADLLRRVGAEVSEEMETPEGVDKDWLRYQTLYEMLMEINTRFAVAEHEGRLKKFAGRVLNLVVKRAGRTKLGQAARNKLRGAALD